MFGGRRQFQGTAVQSTHNAYTEEREGTNSMAALRSHRQLMPTSRQLQLRRTNRTRGNPTAASTATDQRCTHSSSGLPQGSLSLRYKCLHVGRPASPKFTSQQYASDICQYLSSFIHGLSLTSTQIFRLDSVPTTLKMKCKPKHQSHREQEGKQDW